MSDQPVLAKAPNGKQYRIHRGTTGNTYVYALGHRVYGRTGLTYVNGRQTLAFIPSPQCKWAFIVAPLEHKAPVGV